MHMLPRASGLGRFRSFEGFRGFVGDLEEDGRAVLACGEFVVELLQASTGDHSRLFPEHAHDDIFSGFALRGVSGAASLAQLNGTLAGLLGLSADALVGVAGSGVFSDVGLEFHDSGRMSALQT